MRASASSPTARGSRALSTWPLSRCSGWSHAHTRTWPLASPLATQKPFGANFAHVTGWLCPLYTKQSAGSASARTTTALPAP